MRVLRSMSQVVLVASMTTAVYAQAKPSNTPGAKAAAVTAGLTPASAPANDAAGKAAPSGTEQAKTEILSQDGYTYEPAGRRDPFLTLIGPSNDVRSKKGEGASGMAVNEISVRGVLEARGKLVAMVKGPDNKTYIVHQGDRLLDGAIKSITPQGLVIEQEVNDPLSVVKQREVRKLLRGLEETK